MQYGLAQEYGAQPQNEGQGGALGGVSSPISSGAFTAMNHIRQATAMNESEKRRALGLGLMGFASALSKPGYGQGLSGMLGAVNAGFSPAIQAYLNEQNRVEQQNANVLKTVMDAEDKQAERDYKEKHLQEMARHNKAQEVISGTDAEVNKQLKQIQLNQKKMELENKKALTAEDTEIYKNNGDRVQSIQTMPYQTQLHLEKKGDEFLSKANSASEGLEAINTMKEIATRNPGILSNWKWVQQYSFTHDPSQVKSLIMNSTLPEKDKEDLFNLASASKELLVKSIKGMPNNSLNQQMEKFISGATAGGHMPQKALLNALDKAENHLNYSYQEYGKGVNYFNEGKMYRLKPYNAQNKYQNSYAQESMPIQEAGDNNNLSEAKQPQTITLQSPDGKMITFGGNLTSEKLLQLEQKGFKKVE